MKVKPALAMDHRFDVLFVIDDDNHQTEIAYDPSITAEDLQGDSEEEYTQTILSIVNHFAMLLLLSMHDPIAHLSRAAHVRYKLV